MRAGVVGVGADDDGRQRWHGLRFVTHTALPVGKLVKVDCEPFVALVRVVACNDNDERDWRWLIRSEYVTVRCRRARCGLRATRA